MSNVFVASSSMSSQISSTSRAKTAARGLSVLGRIEVLVKNAAVLPESDENALSAGVLTQSERFAYGEGTSQG